MNETNGESEGSMIVSSVYTSKTYDDVNQPDELTAQANPFEVQEE